MTDVSQHTPRRACDMDISEVHWRLGEALNRGDLDGWEAGFAKSCVKLCSQGGTPSAKQERLMRKLVDKSLIGMLTEDE